MLIDLLSTSNYAHYNIKLAHIIGLEGAIYVNELLNINEKAVRKSKLKEGAMKLKRSYITQRTTFSTTKQLEIENRLVEIGLIIRDELEPDLLSVDIGILTSLIMAEDEALVKDISKIAKKKSSKPLSKSEEDLIKLKNIIKVENDELRRAYYEWIETMYLKQGWLSQKAIGLAQYAVDKFADHNLDVALKIIEIASVNGYKDMEWAINKYKANYAVQCSINLVQINSMTESIGLSDNIF